MRSRHNRRPETPPFGPTLDAASAQLVLFGLIATEALARCDQERRRVELEIDAKVQFEEQHFPEDDSRWAAKRRAWQPVSCEITFLPATSLGLVSAPTITLIARRDLGSERLVRFSICRRGLIRIETSGWPEGVRLPSLPKDPTDLTGALEWARRVVAASLPELLRFVDPLV